MKKLLSVLLITIFIMPGTLVPAQETGWEKVKDFLSSKPMILVYGAVLGHQVKLFLNVSYKNNKQGSSIQKGGMNNDLRRGEKIHRAVMSRKNGLVDYLRDAAIRTNKLVHFSEHNSEFTVGRFVSAKPEETAKALEEIKNDLEIYNEYLVSIGEPRFYFDYQSDQNNYLADISFASNVVEEVKEKIAEKPNASAIQIQYGEAVYKAITARKDGLLGYITDTCTRSKGILFTEEREKNKPYWWSLKIVCENSYPYRPFFSNENIHALKTMRENLEAFNKYLHSIGEPEYYFQYVEDKEYTTQLKEIRFDTRLKEKE